MAKELIGGFLPGFGQLTKSKARSSSKVQTTSPPPKSAGELEADRAVFDVDRKGPDGRVLWRGDEVALPDLESLFRFSRPFTYLSIIQEECVAVL